MPYKRRVWNFDFFYHIGCRGNRREPLFYSETDFNAFFQILEQIHEKIPFELSSYCLMTNHYHLQMRSKEAPISKVMALINKRYANYFNNRYQYTGHVFEKRFFDKVCYGKEGMVEVSRYIHLNPVKAQLAAKPEQYKWSSFQFFKNPKLIQPSYMNTNHILDYYSGTVEEKRMKYYRVVTVTPRNLSENHEKSQ